MAILVSPFRSKARLESDRGAPPAADRLAADEPEQGSAEQWRSLVLRPALSLVSVYTAGSSDHAQLQHGGKGNARPARRPEG